MFKNITFERVSRFILTAISSYFLLTIIQGLTYIFNQYTNHSIEEIKDITPYFLVSIPFLAYSIFGPTRFITINTNLSMEALIVKLYEGRYKLKNKVGDYYVFEDKIFFFSSGKILVQDIGDHRIVYTYKSDLKYLGLEL